MLAEPSFQPREARERVVTRIFESHSAPALFLARNAALSSYATGRQTSLVVDMGHEGTVGAAFHINEPCFSRPNKYALPSVLCQPSEKVHQNRSEASQLAYT